MIRRLTLEDFVFLAFVFVLGLMAPCACAGQPRPDLTPVRLASNTLARVVDVESERHQRQLREEAIGEMARCDKSDVTCRQRAVEDTFARHAAHIAQVKDAVRVQHAIATTLQLAEEACNVERGDCEELARKAAGLAADAQRALQQLETTRPGARP
jgi:hypothetical protein